MAETLPCASKPPGERCDHAGPGGFMGHTCETGSGSARIDRNYEVSNRIESLRREADDLRDEWLCANGWERTSQTPGSYWMWRRREFFCDVDTAERIQKFQSAAAYFAIHPERMGE